MSEEARLRLGANYERDFLKRYLQLDLTDRVRGVRFYLPIEQLMNTSGRLVIREFEKTVTLNVIDDNWKEHLREMDELKQSVQTAVYEQKDPLLIYKGEAFNLFMGAVSKMNREIISMLCRSELMAGPSNNEDRDRERERQRRAEQARLRAQHAEVEAAASAEQRTPTHIQQEDGSERKLSRTERRMIERQDAKKKKRV
jgi:preprotein translocase subunit SecA